MNNKTRLVALRAISPLLALLLWVLSSQSSVPLPETIFGIDKIVHFSYFLAFSLSLHFWFPRRKAFLLVIALSILWGLTDEIHQSFVPGRDASVFDLAADALGSIVGSFAGVYFKRKIP